MDTIPGGKLELVGNLIDLPLDLERTNVAGTQLLFLLSTIFFIFIFSQTTQHNIQNKTKQNSRHILNISKFNQKGGREGRTTRTQKLLL